MKHNNAKEANGIDHEVVGNFRGAIDVDHEAIVDAQDDVHRAFQLLVSMFREAGETDHHLTFFAVSMTSFFCQFFDKIVSLDKEVIYAD